MTTKEPDPRETKEMRKAGEEREGTLTETKKATNAELGLPPARGQTSKRSKEAARIAGEKQRDWISGEWFRRKREKAGMKKAAVVK